MKPVVIEYVILAFACVFISTVSGALESQVVAGATCHHFTRAQRQEAAAIKYAARRTHMIAGCCYSRAAMHYGLQAGIQESQRDYHSAVGLYVRAAAMYAAAGRQARRQLQTVLAALFGAVYELERAAFAGLAADYAEMDYAREQFAMHLSAALNYQRMAAKHVAAGRPEWTIVMDLAAAKHFEASAQCALASRDHQKAGPVYSFAAVRYATLGDTNKARSMRMAAAKQHEAFAVDRLAVGDRVVAAVAFRKAAQAYEMAGRCDMARSMNEATVAQLEASAARPAIQMGAWNAAEYYGAVADACEALGQSEMALLMRREAMQTYQRYAMQLEAQGDKGGAAACHCAAAAVREKMMTMPTR